MENQMVMQNIMESLTFFLLLVYICQFVNFI